jgi:hypothetical protein
MLLTPSETPEDRQHDDHEEYDHEDRDDQAHVSAFLP